MKKSLDSYLHASKRQQQGNLGDEEEARQALLTHPSGFQAPDSKAAKTEVVVEIGSDANRGTKSKVSFEEVLHEAVRRKGKDPSGEANYQRPSTNAFYRRNSWQSLVNRSKSRLSDHIADSSGETYGEDSDHEDEGKEDVHGGMEYMKLRVLTCLKWVLYLLISAALVCTFFVPVIKKQRLWDLPIWKWEVMVFALICGRSLSEWGVKLVVIAIEHNFLLRDRVLYFVYGLKKAVQNCLWLSFILLVWNWLLEDKIMEQTNSEILPYLTKILVCLLVATFVWFLKTLLVKVLALNFHVNTFFERIREALFNQYVIERLSGHPLFDRQGQEPESDRVSNLQNRNNIDQTRNLQKSPTVGTSSRFSRTGSKKRPEEITIDDLSKLNKKNIPTSIMKRMMKLTRQSSLCTLDEQILNTDIEDDTKLLVTSELQAREAAEKIFNNVARPGVQSIFLQDLVRFMDTEEAWRTMHHLGASSEKEGISKSAFDNWAVIQVLHLFFWPILSSSIEIGIHFQVSVFRERKALALSLNDTKTAVDELHVLLNIVVGIIIIIIWLVIFGIPIAHFLIFLSSQLVVMAFVFGNTCKTTFEAIVFLFVMHPYDVGDRCEVDGIQVVVEEMNILSTVFLRPDNQKIMYPNSVLATKPIVNYHRSPDTKEAIEFCVHISTPLEKIAGAKERMKKYIEDNEEVWHSDAEVFVADVEDMNKMKILLTVTHRGNSQDMGKIKSRRCQLVEHTITVLKELGIEYRMLPFDVNVRNLPSPLSTRLPSNWIACAN